MKVMLALAAALLLLAVGCASRDTGEVEGTQRGAYSEVIVLWQGRDLHCVRLDTGTGQSDDSGLSCDWVSFHKND